MQQSYREKSLGFRIVVGLAVICHLATVAFAEDDSASGPTDRDRLLAVHRKDANEYTIFRDASRKEKLQLINEPVYRWSNPTRSGGQVGDVFIWTYDGQPAAIATIFSHPENDRRVLCHEWHSLSTTVIVPERVSPNRWQPKGGIKTVALDPAPEPSETAVKRLIQLRNLARDFSANSRDEKGEQWELRLLPHPLYRYETTKGDVFDGAVFAFVTTAGTDPEIVLKIEAVRKDGKQSEWRIAAARFSDLNLYLRFKDKEVWTSIRDQKNEFDRNQDETFRFYRDRIIKEILGAPDTAKKTEK